MFVLILLMVQKIWRSPPFGCIPNLVNIGRFVHINWWFNLANFFWLEPSTNVTGFLHPESRSQAPKWQFWRFMGIQQMNSDFWLPNSRGEPHMVEWSVLVSVEDITVRSPANFQVLNFLGGGGEDCRNNVDSHFQCEGSTNFLDISSYSVRWSVPIFVFKGEKTEGVSKRCIFDFWF